MHSILLAAFLLLSSGFGNGQVSSGANPNTDALSNVALLRVGGGNSSGYEILSPVGGWDTPEYADGMLISIRANWYPRTLSLPDPPAGQRETIIDVHIRGNGTIRHMGTPHVHRKHGAGQSRLGGSQGGSTFPTFAARTAER